MLKTFFPFPARKRAQLGMTLIETMLVLMIGVLVIAGVVVLAQSVLSSMKVNRSKQVLAQIASGIQVTFSNSASSGPDPRNPPAPYADLDSITDKISGFSFIPRDLVSKGNVYLPVGDGKTASVTVYSDDDANHRGTCFWIDIGDSAGFCSDLVLTDFGANSLCASNPSRPAKGVSTENVGQVEKTDIGPNARASAFSAKAVGSCKKGNEDITWYHV